MDPILEIARKHRLRVLEDAAHALPCTRAGKMIGTRASDVTVFSFYANKTITTGEGGMLVTRDAAIAARARTMRLHGINPDAFDRFTAKQAGHGALFQWHLSAKLKQLKMEFSSEVISERWPVPGVSASTESTASTGLELPAAT